MTKKLAKEKQKMWNILKNGVSPGSSVTFNANGDLIVNGRLPVNPVTGSIYFRADAKMMIFDGTEWKAIV